MAIPFPSTAPVLFGHRMPKSTFRGASPPTNVYWFDENNLVGRVASVTSNDGKTLVVTAAGSPHSYDLTGDGTQNIPVGVLTP